MQLAICATEIKKALRTASSQTVATDVQRDLNVCDECWTRASVVVVEELRPIFCKLRDEYMVISKELLVVFA